VPPERTGWRAAATIELVEVFSMLIGTQTREKLSLAKGGSATGGRLVVLSNRMAPTEPGQPPKGGLAVGLYGALKASGGVWMGWSGETAEEAGPARAVTVDDVTYSPVHLTAEQLAGYYKGFSNQVLWPTLHSRTDLIDFEPQFIEAYREVNRLFASELAAILEPEDVLWVHDYHLFLVGRELRNLGIENPIGFFLHTPFPTYDTLRAVPEHEELLKAMFAYDLAGFHTRDFVENFRECCARLLDIAPSGDDLRCDGEDLRVSPFPIGIDADRMAEYARREAQTMRFAHLLDSFMGAKICIGVDRLDYSKGIPERMRGFARFLDLNSSAWEKATLLQIAPPSRDDVREYQDLRDEVVRLAGEINAKYTSPEWVSIRFVHKSFSRRRLAGYYRASRVGLVTPLRDGMNLVAKEYVVCQNPNNPGVLVLSEFAGAREELECGALIVNPHDIDALASAIKDALVMPLEERQERHARMLEVIRGNTATDWSRRFLAALAGSDQPMVSRLAGS